MISSTAAESRTQEIVKQLMHQRMQKGISRRQLAVMLGSSEAAIYRWETNRAKFMRMESLIEYAAAVGCEIEIAVKPRLQKTT